MTATILFLLSVFGCACIGLLTLALFAGLFLIWAFTHIDGWVM